MQRRGTSTTGSKIFVIGFVTFLLGGALATTIFIPMYSADGKERRDKFIQTGKVDPSPYAGSKAGSMWKNMDREIKQNRDD